MPVPIFPLKKILLLKLTHFLKCFIRVKLVLTNVLIHNSTWLSITCNFIYRLLLIVITYMKKNETIEEEEEEGQFGNLDIRVKLS